MQPQRQRYCGLTAPLPFLQRCGPCPSYRWPGILHQLQRWKVPQWHRRQLRFRLFWPVHHMPDRKTPPPPIHSP